MSDSVSSVSEAVARLSRCDPTLDWLRLGFDRYTDSQLAELGDCLLAHPDVVELIDLSFNHLTDETGVKLARYLAASSTVQALSLSNNRLGSGTYLALAAALRINSSLRVFCLYDNQAVDRTRIDAAFVEALRLNPVRPTGSDWWIYSTQDDFKRLKDAADELGHPSLQLLLAVLC